MASRCQISPKRPVGNKSDRLFSASTYDENQLIFKNLSTCQNYYSQPVQASLETRLPK